MMAKEDDSGARQHGDGGNGNEGGNPEKEQKTPIVFTFEGEYSVVDGGIGNGKGGRSNAAVATGLPNLGTHVT